MAGGLVVLGTLPPVWGRVRLGRIRVRRVRFIAAMLAGDVNKRKSVVQKLGEVLCDLSHSVAFVAATLYQALLNDIKDISVFDHMHRAAFAVGFRAWFWVYVRTW